MLQSALVAASMIFCVAADGQQALRKIFREINRIDFTKARVYLIDGMENVTEKKIRNGKWTYAAAGRINGSAVWTTELFDGATIVSAHYLDSVAKKSIWEVPVHYGFSLPYCKDKQSFLLFYREWCGTLCAEHSLRLYKKAGKKGKYVKAIFREVS